LEFGRIDPTNNNYPTINNLAEKMAQLKTPQLEKTTWRNAMTLGAWSTLNLGEAP
jgi:hypothetical protein